MSDLVTPPLPSSSSAPSSPPLPPSSPPLPPPRSKLRRRLLWGLAAALLAAFLGGVLLPMWLRHRANEEAWAQIEAVERTIANPGTLLLDPAVPAGVLVVTLVPAVTGFVLEQPATIRIDTRSYAWTPEARGRFHDLAAERPYPVTVVGPYAVEPFTASLPNGGPGARVALRAIPLDPLQTFRFDSASDYTPEKRLEIDTTEPDKLELRWLQGITVIAMMDIPRAATPSPSGRPAYPGLADKVTAQWQMQGSHRDPSDRRFDRAIVRALPWTPFDELFAITGAILRTTRETRGPEGEFRTVPAFNVSVQPPSLPLPPPSPYIAEPEPPPRVAGPKVEMAPISVSGRLPLPVIERILQQRRGRVRQCYETALEANPTLSGRIGVRFVVGADGAVSRVSNGGSSTGSSGSALADEAMVKCIVHAVDDLSFPQPEGGIVSVVVPFLLSPGLRPRP